MEHGTPPEPKKHSLRRFIRMSRLRLIALLVTALVLIAVGLSAWLWVPGAKTYRVVITGGHPRLNRHKVAEHLKRHSGELNLEVEIRPAEGTPEAVARVQSGELDLALVNGLIRFPDATAVRQVATITVEPFHLLVKRESAKAVADDYGKLKGMSLDVGPAGAETALVAGAVIKFLGLKVARPDLEGVRLSTLGIDELFARLDRLEKAPVGELAVRRADLPDAVFHVSTLPSSLAQRLITVGGYELVPLRFSRAFALVTVEEEELDRDHIDQIHTETAAIPAFTYGGTPPVPPEDYPSLGAPLIVIANKDVPDEVVARILPRIYGGSVGRLYQPPDLSTVTPVYPLHPAAVSYRDRDRPIVRADVANVIRQVVGGVAPLVGGCVALFGYYRWRQVLRFLNYFRKLQHLDLVAKGLLPANDLPLPGPERVRALEGELAALQRRAVDDFCRNYFYGEGVLENFLALLAETRDFLRRSSLEPLPPANDQTPT